MKATSSLLAELLDRTAESVLVLRNYHGYPETITGDVDFLVRDPSSAFWRNVEAAVSLRGWSVAQILDRPWIRKYTLCNVAADRPFLVLDFFCSLSWYTLPFLDMGAVFRRAQTHRAFRIPGPADEALVTLVHYALYNGHAPEKYRTRGQQSFERYAGSCERSLSEAFGTVLARAFVAAVRDGAWDQVPRLAPRMRLALLRRRATAPALAGLVASLPSVVLARRAVPGTVLAVEGSAPDPAVSELTARLKSSHVFSCIRELEPARSVLGAALRRTRLALALRRGECVVLWRTSASDLPGRAGRRLPPFVSVATAGSEPRFRLHAGGRTEAGPGPPARLAEALLRRSAAALTGRPSGSASGDTVKERCRRPRSLRVVLLGPDGVGKSTVARSLRVLLASPGRSVEIRHWRPQRRRAAGPRAPVRDPHGRPPRSWAGSLLKLAWLYALFLGDALWFRARHRGSGRIEVFDRYFPDLVVDPRRYRYGGPLRPARAAWRALPKPDLVLLLDAPPDVVRQRAREVSREETERQIDAYRTLLDSLPNGHRIDAAQPLRAVVEEAARIVLALEEGAREPTGTARPAGDLSAAGGRAT